MDHHGVRTASRKVRRYDDHRDEGIGVEFGFHPGHVLRVRSARPQRKDCEARPKPTTKREQRSQTNSANENPVTHRKEATWIPLATAREGRELCIGVEIQSTSYEFIIDTGADVCLVQPYVEDEPTKEIGDAVNGIT
jgi:hypothetical protein